MIYKDKKFESVWFMKNRKNLYILAITFFLTVLINRKIPKLF